LRTIKEVVPATKIEVNKPGLNLFRVVGTTDLDGRGTKHAISDVDPILFLDDAKLEGNISTAFAKHPHTGLTAVTYLLEGTMHAWDNLHGETKDLNHAGGVYIIDSGRGVVHGEAPTSENRKVRLLQMWFNPGIYQSPLPEASYQLFQPEELPIFADENLWAKVIIGKCFGISSPVQIRWPLLYLHLKLTRSQSYTLELPDKNWNGFIYVIKGAGRFGDNQMTGTVWFLITKPQKTFLLRI
jgi:redox-sensitive bicupin YhaK (pirin superfamily)